MVNCLFNLDLVLRPRKSVWSRLETSLKHLISVIRIQTTTPVTTLLAISATIEFKFWFLLQLLRHVLPLTQHVANLPVGCPEFSQRVH